jgi:hypothetical protein
MTATQTIENKYEELSNFLRQSSLPASDRADVLIFTIKADGIDMREFISQLISDWDVGRELKKKADAEGTSALVAERFLGKFTSPEGHSFAIVTRGQGHVCLPAAPEKVAQYQVGDPVLVDPKLERVVGRDGHVPTAGEIVSVDSLPAGKPGYLVVKHHERRQVARLHNDLLCRPELCQPGKELIYDPISQFALAGIETGSNGDELLVDPNRIAKVRRPDVGAPKPVVDEILDLFRQHLENPDWIDQMRVPQRASYLFAGVTGGGKSYHLSLIFQGVLEIVEEFCGVQSSRLVMVDTSRFYSPYFGVTEQNINGWMASIQKLGEQQHRARDGRLLRVPLVIALEECEALLRSRGESQGSGHLFDRPLALLLQKTESLESALRVPIIWIMTTNRPSLVDSAALRRMGCRQVNFGALRPSEASAVLKTKIPASMPIYGEDRDGQEARDALIRSVIGYAYGPEPKQAIAEVRLGNSERRYLNRADLVTPAVIQEAVSRAVSRCLRKSRGAGRLLGLDAADVIGALDRHFAGLARNLRPHNVAEYATDWYERDRPTIVDVIPLVSNRRPVPFLDAQSNGHSVNNHST